MERVELYMENSCGACALSIGVFFYCEHDAFAEICPAVDESVAANSNSWIATRKTYTHQKVAKSDVVIRSCSQRLVFVVVGGLKMQQKQKIQIARISHKTMVIYYFEQSHSRRECGLGQVLRVAKRAPRFFLSPALRESRVCGEWF